MPALAIIITCFLIVLILIVLTSWVYYKILFLKKKNLDMEEKESNWYLFPIFGGFLFPI
jgi:hypothetical protein